MKKSKSSRNLLFAVAVGGLFVVAPGIAANDSAPARDQHFTVSDTSSWVQRVGALGGDWLDWMRNLVVGTRTGSGTTTSGSSSGTTGTPTVAQGALIEPGGVS